MKTNLRFYVASAPLALAFLLTTLWVGQGHINWDYGNAKHARAAVTNQQQKTSKMRQLNQLLPNATLRQNKAL